jgi:hypothetical protein
MQLEINCIGLFAFSGLGFFKMPAPTKRSLSEGGPVRTTATGRRPTAAVCIERDKAAREEVRHNAPLRMLTRLENLSSGLAQRAAEAAESSEEVRCETARAAARIGQPFEHVSRIGLSTISSCLATLSLFNTPRL